MQSNSKNYSIGANDLLFKMGGLGLILFAPAYTLLKSGYLSYNTLLFIEGAFFANPHLISTYLRTSTDEEEFKRHPFLNIFLPLLLLLGISGLIFKFGSSIIWTLGTLYFYWQWWHHARQSYGIGRNYQRYLQVRDFDKKLNDLTLWTWAIYGICLKSNSAHDYYEGIPIRVFHLPDLFIQSLLITALIITAYFLFRQVKLYLKTKLVQVPFLFHLSISSFVFVCFFGLLPTDLGIIAASLWHCTQYISYVKDHQEKKAKNGVIKNIFWKNLFTNEATFNYLIILFLFSSLIILIKLSLSSLQISSIILGFTMTLTFHHYLLDGVIWSQKEVLWSYLIDYRVNSGESRGSV